MRIRPWPNRHVQSKDPYRLRRIFPLAGVPSYPRFVRLGWDSTTSVWQPLFVIPTKEEPAFDFVSLIM
jgi:hypothetical protein